MRATRAVAALSLALSFAAARPARAQVITFDAVPTAAGAGPITTASGFTFANFSTLEAGSTFGAGSNASSGARFAYVRLQPPPADGSPRFGSVRRTDVNLNLFDAFLSFRRFDAVTTPVAITVNAYRGFDPASPAVFTQSVLLTNTAQRVTFNWLDVSEVEFLTDPLETGRSAVLAVDDLRVAAVPEPATVVLLGAGGLVLLAGTRRRQGGRAA